MYSFIYLFILIFIHERSVAPEQTIGQEINTFQGTYLLNYFLLKVIDDFEKLNLTKIREYHITPIKILQC